MTTTSYPYLIQSTKGIDDIIHHEVYLTQGEV